MNILIAEDDPALATFIRDGLAQVYDDVHVVGDGRAAVDAACTRAFDALVLDRMLPELDGIEVIHRLHAEKLRLPVLMLTALGSLDDRIEGLEAGADDYLVKPFAMSELIARLNALARRNQTEEPSGKLRVGGLELDLVRHVAKRDRRVIPLQRREFGLLTELVRNVGSVVTRTMLLERVWNYNFDPQTNIVETHVSRLRSKLNEGGEDDLIITVRGGGYMIRSEP